MSIQKQIYDIADANTDQPHYPIIKGKRPNPLSQLVRLLRETSAKETKKKGANWVLPLTDTRRKWIAAGLENLLKRGVSRGARDNTALIIACECAKVGHDRERATQLLEEWNQLNKPPLPDSALERVLRQAYDVGYDFGTNNDTLREAREAGMKDRETLTPNHTSPTPDGDSVGDDNTPVLLDLDDLIDNPSMYEPPEPLGRWLSWRNQITLLAGREKLGKGTLCTYEAMECLKRGLTVLWVSSDEPVMTIVHRFKEAGYQRGMGKVRITDKAHGITDWRTLGDLIFLACDPHPDLIILDSVSSIAATIQKKIPDNSESAAWHTFIGKMRVVSQSLNCSVIWVHHSNKLTGDYAGSHGIGAAADTIITMKPYGNSTGRTLYRKGRYTCDELTISLIKGKGYVDVTDVTKKTGESDARNAAERCRDWFIANPPECTFSSWREVAQFYNDKSGESIGTSTVYNSDVIKSVFVHNGKSYEFKSPGVPSGGSVRDALDSEDGNDE